MSPDGLPFILQKGACIIEDLLGSVGGILIDDLSVLCLSNSNWTQSTSVEVEHFSTASGRQYSVIVYNTATKVGLSSKTYTLIQMVYAP
jgi:hypothetical protein